MDKCRFKEGWRRKVARGGLMPALGNADEERWAIRWTRSDLRTAGMKAVDRSQGQTLSFTLIDATTDWNIQPTVPSSDLWPNTQGSRWFGAQDGDEQQLVQVEQWDCKGLQNCCQTWGLTFPCGRVHQMLMARPLILRSYHWGQHICCVWL